jgi:hypothetical protein
MMPVRAVIISAVLAISAVEKKDLKLDSSNNYCGGSGDIDFSQYQ